MDWLEKHLGYVIGDFNTDGVINTALKLRGKQFFVDLHEDPDLVAHLSTVILETPVRVAEYTRRRTGTCSMAVNRSITSVDRAIYLHANCSTQLSFAGHVPKIAARVRKDVGRTSQALRHTSLRKQPAPVCRGVRTIRRGVL